MCLRGNQLHVFPCDSNLSCRPLPKFRLNIFRRRVFQLVVLAMAPARVGPSTEKSVNFNPDTFFEAWSTSTQVTDDDLEKLMKSSFGLAEDDGFVYHAVASVTLAQVQSAISQGGEWGLHAWYLDPTGTQVCTPTADHLVPERALQLTRRLVVMHRFRPRHKSISRRIQQSSQQPRPRQRH